MILIYYFILFSLFNRFIYGSSRNLTIYWNVPTQLCQQYGYDFEQLLIPYTFTINRCDKFEGDKIVRLRNPGRFPHATQHKNGTLYCVNKCIPQGENLSLHLDIFSREIKRKIPNSNFNGLAVIQFEHWEPLFKFNNWGHTQWHRDMALSLEKWYYQYSEPDSLQLDKLAENRFNTHAKIFFEETLKLGQKLRPHAKWGYYNYPKCLNAIYDKRYLESCQQSTLDGNDKLMWLFNASDALFPAVNYQFGYIPKFQEYINSMIAGRLRETKRLLQKIEKKPKVYLYLSMKFIHKDNYVHEEILHRSLEKIQDMDVADGIIMSLKEKDLNREDKCRLFYTFILPPFLNRLKYFGITPKNNTAKL